MRPCIWGSNRNIREVVGDIARLDQTLKASKQRIAGAVQASGTSLAGVVGVVPIGAATIIGYTNRRHPVPHRGPLRSVQRHGTDRSVIRRQHEAPFEPAWEPHLESCHPYCSGHPAATRHEWSHLFRQEDRRGRTPKEAIRALKRRISDAVYRALIADTRRTPTT